MVITIIGILVALLIPTVAGVMKSTRNAAIAVELQDMAKAVEAYKSFANDYPPDFTNVAAVSAHIARAATRETPGTSRRGGLQPTARAGNSRTWILPKLS